MNESFQAAEIAVRNSYGRLLAILAAGSRDIASAEEALSQALLTALRTWPDRGIPSNPDAWLLTAARNAMFNARRHDKVRSAAAEEIERRYEEVAAGRDSIPDERLNLLFVCAHPAIDETIRTPLMLQTVLGLDAAKIAKAFLVAPAAMGQRLVRAKTKIRDAGIRFQLPSPEEYPDRLAHVLQAIYVAFGTAWDENAGAEATISDLAQEAIYLARLLVSLQPDQAEAHGLLALMLYCEARRAARRSSDGRFVPLRDQDTRLWSRTMIIEAEGQLSLASRLKIFGRYQCEAAIQSVHVQRAITGETSFAALRVLYDMLLAHAPSVGTAIARAAMLIEAGQLESAAQALEQVPQDRAEAYQPYWVTKARLASAQGSIEDARAAYRNAISLTSDPALVTLLAGKMTQLVSLPFDRET